MNSDENHDDLELDDEDHLAVSALTEDDIAAIDNAILAEARVHWLKVAMVAAKAMNAYPGEYLDIPDVFFANEYGSLSWRGNLSHKGTFLACVTAKCACLRLTKMWHNNSTLTR